MKITYIISEDSNTEADELGRLGVDDSKFEINLPVRLNTGDVFYVRTFKGDTPIIITEEKILSRPIGREVHIHTACLYNNDDYILKSDINKGNLIFFEKNECKGKKESQYVKKAPIFTYCQQMKNAIEQLALRSLYGHEKYEEENDWENFSRVDNGDFEYSNAMFRHALGIGEDTEEEHLIAAAWNAVARLEIFLRKNLRK